MPEIPLHVDEAGQVRLLWTLGTVTANNVLGVRIPAGTQITQTLANTLGAAIKSSFTSSGQAALVATGVSLSHVNIRDIRSPNLVEWQDAGASVPGTAVGDVLPLQTCAVITLRTNNAGKRFRGRVFLFGYTETVNASGGNATPTVGTTGVAFINAIMGNLTSSGLTLGVISRPVNDRTTGAVIRPGLITNVTGVVSRNDFWETQRRRSPGR